MQARWPRILHGMDDEGGGPISGTSSKASVADGLPDTLCVLSSMPMDVSNFATLAPPRSSPQAGRNAPSPHDRSPPHRDLTRSGSHPTPLARSVSLWRTAPHNPNIQVAALFPDHPELRPSLGRVSRGWRRIEGCPLGENRQSPEGEVRDPFPRSQALMKSTSAASEWKTVFHSPLVHTNPSSASFSGVGRPSASQPRYW